MECWICLEPLAEPVRVCDCSNQAHHDCLFKWRMHNIGKDEEKRCRFCACEYRDIREYFRGHMSNVVEMKFYCGGSQRKLSLMIDPRGGHVQQFKNIMPSSVDERSILYVEVKLSREDIVKLTSPLSDLETLDKVIQCAAYIKQLRNQAKHVFKENKDQSLLSRNIKRLLRQ